MDGLPEDQRDDDEDSRSSSGAPSTPEDRPSTPQNQPVHEGGAAAYQVVVVPAPVHHQGAQPAPLLLRHASISSLDESSQKYKTSVSTFSDGSYF